MIENTVEFQLGVMIGEYIINMYLPTLDTDMLKTRHVINVSDEDRINYEMLDKIWYEKTNKNGKEASKDDWNKLHDFTKKMEEKYLPHILECRVPLIQVENITELKAGIRESLWDCDACSYKIETDDDIIIEDEHIANIFHESIIKLKLDV